MDLRQQIGKRLKEIRLLQSKTAKDIAVSSGMTETTVYSIESGKNISIDSLDKYLSAVNATITIKPRK